MFFKEKLIFKSGGHSNYRIPSLITTNNGTVLAFCNDRKDSLADHSPEVALVLCCKEPGGDWGEVETLLGYDGWACGIGTAVYDDVMGNAFIFCRKNCVSIPEYKIFSQEELEQFKKEAQEKAKRDGIGVGHYKLVSSDNGKTWKESPVSFEQTEYTHSDGRVLKTNFSTHGSAHGIMLRHGKYQGRLICPSRFTVDRYDGKEGLKFNCYNNAVYSDDHGETWKCSTPVQLGTGEGTLIELADGTILYNSRAYFGDGKRYLATSVNGGESFGDFCADDFLMEETNIGCNASLIRVEKAELVDASLLPGYADSITLFCNPRAATRDNMSICISFDSGKSWDSVKTVFPGHAAYSSLCFDAVSQHFYLIYERGEEHSCSDGIMAAEFDLEWLLSEE